MRWMTYQIGLRVSNPEPNYKVRRWVRRWYRKNLFGYEPMIATALAFIFGFMICFIYVKVRYYACD